MRWKAWKLCGLAGTHNCQRKMELKNKMHQTDFTKIFPTDETELVKCRTLENTGSMYKFH